MTDGFRAMLKRRVVPHCENEPTRIEGRKGILHNTVNVTIVRGGEKVNVIPSEAALELDGRRLPGFGPEDMGAELEDLLGDLESDVEIEVFRHDPGPSEPATGMFGLLSEILCETDPEAVPVPWLVPGVTEGRVFSRLGIQTYGFLPEGFGFFRLIHVADERVPVEALTFGALHTRRSGASARRSTMGNPPSDTGGTAAGSNSQAGFTLFEERSVAGERHRRASEEQ